MFIIANDCWGLGVGGDIQELYKIPVRGFVNAMAMSRNSKLLVAGIGQEPRLGRWARDSGARNGLLIHRIEVADE
jgi:ribosomal RNA-processing protein 9